MRIRGIEFGAALGASGVQGFFGGAPEYHQHRLFHWLGINWPDFSGMTFTAKTATVASRKGNMPQDRQYRPIEWLPRSVVGNPINCASINAVGLSNPGIQALLDTGKWQQRQRPFMISFMPVGQTAQERRQEVEDFVRAVYGRLPPWVGLQLNISCPNTAHGQSELISEVRIWLDILSVLEVPLLAKINLLLSPEGARAITRHPACDGLCVTNTIPWGELSDSIPWGRLFPFSNGQSPLIARGLPPGGYAGPLLRPLLSQWIREFRRLRSEKHVYINAGSVYKPADVDAHSSAGADSVAIGTVAIWRPWRVRPIIDRAAQLFK